MTDRNPFREQEDQKFDPCAGGHPGPGWYLHGAEICTRCGRPLDMSRCSHGLAVAFCSEDHDHIRAGKVRDSKVKAYEQMCR